MEMQKVKSSNIDSIGYEGTTLRVRFLNGNEYEYVGVPAEKADGMGKAESPGRYFAQEIKGQYSAKVVSRKGVQA